MERPEILTQLRCGTNDLRIHNGRFDDTKANDRYCFLCANDNPSVENEQHFLLECEHYSDRRKILWNDIISIVKDGEKIGEKPATTAAFDPSSLPSNEQLIILTCGKHPLIVGAITTHRVMSRILVEIAEWSRMRKEFFTLVERASSA
jgi:hypothetical protein